MKRIISFICLLALLLAGCSTEWAQTAPTIPEGDYTHGVYQLTFSRKLLSNYSVGNSWSFTYTYNDEVIQNGYTITYPLNTFSFQPINVEVREKDIFDDIGTGTLLVAMCDGGTGKTEVTVTETHGCHKGNTAVWEISCHVQLVEKQ